MRAVDSKALLSYGFRYFEPYTPVKGNQVLTSKEVRLGNTNSVDLGTASDVSFVIPINSKDKVKASFVLTNKKIVAPIKKGQKMGVITFTLNNEPIYQLPLVALNDVEEGGFLSRSWDHVVISVKNWFE